MAQAKAFEQDGPADAIDPNWELVKKSLEGLMIKEVWLTLSTIAYYSRLSLSYQLDRFCGSDGQASAYKALIAEGMLPAAAGARMSQCNEIGRGLIWAQIESIGTDYYYVCLVTGEYWEYTNTLGNRTVYGSANAETEASDFHAACAAACAAANVTAFCSCYYETDDLGAPTGLLHGDGYPESWDCRESTLYPAAEETGAWSLPVWDECVGCRAAKESEIPNFKGSYLGRFPLVSADSWTSDHLSERSPSVHAFSGTRARETLTLKRS